MEKVGDCADDNNYSTYNGIICRDFCVGLLGFASDLNMIKHVGISSRKHAGIRWYTRIVRYNLLNYCDVI